MRRTVVHYQKNTDFKTYYALKSFFKNSATPSLLFSPMTSSAICRSSGTAFLTAYFLSASENRSISFLLSPNAAILSGADQSHNLLCAVSLTRLTAVYFEKPVWGVCVGVKRTGDSVYFLRRVIDGLQLVISVGKTYKNGCISSKISYSETFLNSPKNLPFLFS